MGNDEDKRFDELVGLAYESIQDISKLIPMMQGMCREVGALAGHYVRMDISNGDVFASCISEDAYAQVDAEYSSYFGSVDPRLEWLGTGSLGEWRTDYQRFDDKFIGRSEFYNDFLAKYDFRHVAAGYIGETGKQKEMMGIVRPLGAAKFSEEEHHFLRRLSPHLIRSATLRSRLEQLNWQQAQDQSILSHLPYGTVWVNTALKIVSMNTAAAGILAQGDGLRIADNRLIPYELAERETLDRALRIATAPEKRQGQWFAVSRRKQKEPLLISVIPATMSGEFNKISDGPFALVILQDTAGQMAPRAVQLQGVFKLTSAEGRLAEALLQNETLQSYATKIGLTRNTTRTHLSGLFAKTGTRRQSELMRILLTAQPHIAP